MRYKNTDCPVPAACAHREVIVTGYADEAVIAAGADEIARHGRSCEAADFVFDPLHCLALLERNVGALDQAAPLQGWELPTEFATLRRLLEARLSGKNRCAAGKRDYVQVLRPLETCTLPVVHGAIKHLASCLIDGRPARLDLANHPHLPLTNVATTAAAKSMSLLTGGPT